MDKKELLRRIKKLLESRIHTLNEIKLWIDYIVGDIPEYSVDTLCGKLTREKALAVVTDVYKWMSSTNNVDEFERFCREDLTSKYGLKLGTIAHPIRVSITGKTVSLPLFETMEVIGRELCLQRLELSIKKLKGDIPEL